jgi:hypothetical protein
MNKNVKKTGNKSRKERKLYYSGNLFLNFLTINLSLLNKVTVAIEMNFSLILLIFFIRYLSK